MRITVDGVLEHNGPRQVWRRIHFGRIGLHTVTVEVVDNQGVRVAKTLSVYVRRPEPVLGPRFSLFVVPHLPTADVIREGLPVSVMCKHTCSAAVELQITRYRARKLGLRRPRRGKLTVAADVGFYSNWEHHFLLRPNRRVRRAFRRAGRLPVLLKVTSFRESTSDFRRRTTQTEIQLTGRPRRRGR
jgi:hypothetical protein